MYQNLVNDSQEDIYHHENTSHNNTQEYGLIIPQESFYIIICGLVCLSFGSAVYRSFGQCCGRAKRYRQKHNLQRYLITHEVEEMDTLPDPCTICLEPITANDVTVELHCGHKFHSACIAEWFQKELTCPNCRSPLEI